MEIEFPVSRVPIGISLSGDGNCAVLEQELGWDMLDGNGKKL